MFESISFVKLTIIGIIVLLAILSMRSHFKGHFLIAWLLIGFVVFALYSYTPEFSAFQERLSANLRPGEVYQQDTNLVLTKSNDGHFYINGYIGDDKIRFLIDTGASQVLLKHQFASSEHEIQYTGHTANFATAGGTITAFEIIIPKLIIGSKDDLEARIEMENFRAYIVEKKTDFLSHSLLGISFLEKLKSYKFEGNSLIITDENKAVE